jgi:hypothetical protein
VRLGPCCATTGGGFGEHSSGASGDVRASRM